MIDSHAHLTCADLLPDLDQVIKNAQDAGVDAVVNICSDIEALRAAKSLNGHWPDWLFHAAATAQHDVAARGEEEFEEMALAAQEGFLIAVGETGLDYHYDHSPKETQKEFLIRYLKLARQCDLPIIIHCREAFADLFTILDEHYATEKGEWLPGVLHCFTGSLEEAKKLVEKGWMISFSGIVTFKKSEELRRVAAEVPLEQLLAETDSPYLAPQSHRGKRNEPAYVGEVIDCLAHCHQVGPEQMRDQVTANARRLFKIVSH